MKQLLDAISERCCILFAGSGVCRDAGLPDWKGLASQIIDFLPSGSAGVDKAFYKSFIDDPAKLPSFFDVVMSKVERQIILKVMRDLLKPKKDSQTVDILKTLNFRGVVTTNYDKLIDNIVAADCWRLYNSLEDFTKIDTILAEKTQFLLKIHGDIDNILGPGEEPVMKGASFMVLSKNDYTNFLSSRKDNLQLAFHSILAEAPLLFLGYSFNDPDIDFVFKFLNSNLKFAHKSWYVGLRNGVKPSNLPANVEFIDPIDHWDELHSWLKKLKNDIKEVAPTCKFEFKKITTEEKDALNALAEFLNGIETNDISVKTLTSVVVAELSDKKEIDLQWVINFISDFLAIGLSWAETFAVSVIEILLELGVIEFDKTDKLIRVKPQIILLKSKVQRELQHEKSDFLNSIEKRLAETSVKLSSDFIEKYNDALVDLSMRFGESLAKSIHHRIGQAIDNDKFRNVFNGYFGETEEARYALDITKIIFDNTHKEEVPYLYRLISAALLLNSIKLKPEASTYLKTQVSNYEIYCDTNILLPLIIKEHPDHPMISSVIKATNEVGAKLFILEDYLNEIDGHLNLAHDFLKLHNGNINNIKQYLLAAGRTTNCFIRGFLNGSKLSWTRYLSCYSPTQVRRIIEDEYNIKIDKMTVDDPDKISYAYIKDAIKKEWDNRLHMVSRNEILNEHDAKQFLHIYSKRKEKKKYGLPTDIWFLSYETVFEQIYRLNPASWEKPPTFRLPAWASFIDSYLMASNHDLTRKDVLKAILSSTSSVYEIPDPLTIVKNKVFGARLISKDELEALKVAMSDGSITTRLERAQKALANRKKDASQVNKFTDALDDLVGEVKKEQAEKMELLKEQLSREKSRGAQKDKTIEELTNQLKAGPRRAKRRRHKSR